MVLRNQECWYKDVCSYESCTNCIRYSEMRYLMDNSGLPKKKQVPVALVAGMDMTQFCQLSDIKDDIMAFVDNGESLYIYSKFTGNGKTSWAIKLLLRYFDQVWAGNGFRMRGYFAHVPTMLSQLKEFRDDTARKALMRKLTGVDLLVLDDIASTKLTDWETSQLLSIVDIRISEGLATIYTGNLVTLDALESVLGDRLASRIWNVSTLIEFKGRDRRNTDFN